LRNIYLFIREDSPRYAKATYDGIRQKTEALKTSKRIGRIVPEYEIETVRELIYKSWRIS